MNCEFTKNDLETIIYWIVQKFRVDQFHMSSVGQKSDSIGGFIDRWVGRVPEIVVPRELLKDRDYEAVADFFLYGQDTKKNAPDILGLEDKQTGRIVKFTEFREGSWHPVSGMPQVEVKKFDENQAMLSIDEPDMKDDWYYLLTVAYIRRDYLTAVFEDSILSNEIYESLKTEEAFIESDSSGGLIPIREPENVSFNEELGYFKLLGIFKGSEVKKYCRLMGEGEKPRYIGSIEKENSPVIKHSEKLNEGIYTCTMDNAPFLPIYVKLLNSDSEVEIVKKLKGYWIIRASGEVKINGEALEDGYYRITFKKFDRSKKTREYIGHKKIFENGYPEDKTEELVNRFDEIIENERRNSN